MTKFLGICVAILGFVLTSCESKTETPAVVRKGSSRSSSASATTPSRIVLRQNEKMTQLWGQFPDVRFSISDAQKDDNKQIEQISTLIRQKPDLLIVAPNQRAPLSRVMGEAMKAGIPVICLERDIAEPNYTTWIRCDNLAIGKAAGEFIVEHLKKKNGSPKGKIVSLKGLLGVEGETNRNNGALEVFKNYRDIKIVHEAVAGGEQSEGQDRMTEALNANPQIDVVYGHNDPMAIGAYLAAKAKGREKEMIFVGVDGLGGEAGGIKKSMDGVLAATFVYPLCVDKAVEIGNKIMRDKNFKRIPATRCHRKR
jgi:ribose transport system substrate-binding protein